MNYLIPAFFIIGLGLVCFLIHFVPALLIITFGVLLLLAKTGLWIDVKAQRAMAYRSILGHRFGKSFDLSGYDRVELDYTNEETLMQSRGVSNVVRARTYDITLYKSDGLKDELYEFTDYPSALHAYRVLVDWLGYHGRNEVAERQRSAATDPNLHKRR